MAYKVIVQEGSTRSSHGTPTRAAAEKLVTDIFQGYDRRMSVDDYLTWHSSEWVVFAVSVEPDVSIRVIKVAS